MSAGYGEDDVVIARHEAALSAAEAAGVRHVVYTSLSGDGDHVTYALAHRWTERRLRRSSMEWTVLRNGLYAEFLTWIATPDAENRITGPLGDGRLAVVARADLADIAVAVATDPAPHAGRVYELVGERPSAEPTWPPPSAPPTPRPRSPKPAPRSPPPARSPSRSRCSRAPTRPSRTASWTAPP
ncbi:NAD(P)H-binding protein [Streptomyces sp. SBR177]